MSVKIITSCIMIICITNINALNRNFHTKKGQLGVYQLMITSKYFETIDDFKNLEFATPKAYCNMEKFHFNPISLTKETIKFFPNLQTLHLYNKNDDRFIYNQIDRRVIWFAKGLNRLQSEPMETICKRYKVNNLSIEHIRYNITGNTVTIARDNIKYDGVSIGSDKAVQSIVLVPSIVQIGKNTFNNCVDIQDVYIPNTVTSIGKSAFAECFSLKRINLPTNVSKISSRTFFKCSNLSAIEIPSSITSIEESAFQHCSSLKEINIPNTVIYIAEGVFGGCRELTKVILPNNLKCIEPYLFKQCFALQELIIPKSVTRLSYECFYDCYSLTCINIPTSVTRIDKLAFARCYSLSGITIMRNTDDRYDKYRIKKLLQDLANAGSCNLMCTIHPPFKKKCFMKRHYSEL